MNKQEQEQYPSLYKALCLSGSLSEDGLRDTFPNTIWNHGGVGTMASCIGFLRGMIAAGSKISSIDKMAGSLFHSFKLGMIADKWEGDQLLTKWDRPHANKLIVTGTTTFMCFGFSYVSLAIHQEAASKENQVYKLIGNAYQSSLSEKKWYYLKNMYGGINFHGLDQTYSVTLDPTIGWQMHT